MRAIEFYAMELFFRLQDQFPEFTHQSIFEQLLTTYCPWNWPLLPDEDRSAYYSHENASITASEVGEILIPLLINDRLELMVVNATVDDIVNERRLRYERAITRKLRERCGGEQEKTAAAATDLLEEAARVAKCFENEDASISQDAAEVQPVKMDINPTVADDSTAATT